MKEINIPLKDNSYNIYINHGLLSDISSYIDLKREIVIITDDFIPKIYLNTIKEEMSNVQVFEVPNGETSKSMEIAYSILDEMVNSRITRNCLVIALGGGVVGDLAGFISSIYMRGVDFIQIPTTLLSQIDSSVGGKVGINSTNMKNAIGAFYQPKMVLIDPDTLKTLSEREFNNGIAEMIKYAMIADKQLFKDLLIEEFLDNLTDYIEKCILIKRDFVINDIFDHGKRQILNFGHTIGHAIEKYSKLSLLHGESISIGMVMMSKNTNYRNDLMKLLSKYSLPTDYEYNKEDIYKYIQTDKKASNKYLNIILVENIGKGFIKRIKIEEIKNYL
ncbi:MAG: 3-dehydroquinate synthase [Candidatus Izimaplasma sp.]|nr:3-dehydroquinate synthase [Candidatus Izimaplasma bacterium]